MIFVFAAAEITVAVITTFGVLVTAILAFVNQRFLRQNVGKANGGGTLTTMVEHALKNQGVLSDDVAELKRTGEVLKRDLYLTKNTLDQHDVTDTLRFDRIEKMLRLQNAVRDERDN